MLESCSSKRNGQYFKYNPGHKHVLPMEYEKLCIEPNVKGFLLSVWKCVFRERAGLGI